MDYSISTEENRNFVRLWEITEAGGVPIFEIPHTKRVRDDRADACDCHPECSEGSPCWCRGISGTPH